MPTYPATVSAMPDNLSSGGPYPGSIPAIVIIGGGFSGTLTAIRLLDGATEPLTIKVIETRADLGRGLAYSARDPAHVTNGPAKVFSLYPERPDHFVRYLARFGRDWGWRDPQSPDHANAHTPRWIYGDYIRAELARAIAHAAPGVAFQHVVAEAHDIRRDGTGVTVTVRDGSEIYADQAVLALGIFQGKPGIHVDPVVRSSGRYIEDPWDAERHETLPRNGKVLLIGSGLTMLDTVIALERRGHRGSYLTISRRGLAVHPRRDVTPLRDFLAEKPLPRTVLALLRAARAELASTPHTRPDWQSLVMAIRPHVDALWLRASMTERRRFLRHLRPIWEMSLHRAPPQSTQLLERGRREGWFDHRAGRLRSLRRAADGRIAAEVVWRGAGEPATILVDVAVNCTGANYVWERIEGRPLVSNLLARGLVRPGPLSFGIDADLTSALIGSDGRRSEMLWAIGPPLRGARWESSTVPELVQQATMLADRLLTRVHSARTSVPVS
jgi:uncharacterized NAD(P)/FAD-binding protein YdhS